MVLRVVLAAVFCCSFISLESAPIDIFSEKHAPLSRIGIIFALPEVSESSDSACPIPWFANSKKTVEGRRTYYSGDYFGKYLVMSSFWPNKVSAAVISCNMILKHRVDLILIIGTCYSRSETGRFGNVLISRGYVNYDSDVRPFFKRFEIPNIHQSIFATSEAYREAAKIGGRQFIAMHKDSIERLLKTYGYLKPTTSTEHGLTEGIIATGEAFSMSKNYFLSLQQIHSEIQGFDSAGGAVAQVCYEFGIPCLGVNILIPHPLESSSNEAWLKLQSETSKFYTDSLLKSVLQEICLTH
ncbi:5'-methylthioadenosine nucleosidase [Chlamydia psittaci]|uniref:5'-methylthioadenosine/S-adenosylhomocysteine nucleosidase family protein n=1 Tax=Chlamydia psittaci TaxID=83554 RepID=UPI00027E5760|nr:5'-methylthioadenosine nucleosidase [Chlamydia psittaci]AFS27082.1 bifunctional nucleosidase [Chlamydia psittaci CP3]KPZ35977.1 5'-methylthioadenosine nucleosidase [Chlamydia psittaci CP3]MBE3635799.1 5'-methylthioadenosine nucleosidase [Chlamydia psittaci]BEU44263.1 5'-methylthioadenosine nucleosidase [Chlamydia psittaci]